MVQWVVGSILHGPIELSCSSQCSTAGVNKAMVCYPMYGMVHIKVPLMVIRKSSPIECWERVFPRHVNGPLACPVPYNHK